MSKKNKRPSKIEVFRENVQTWKSSEKNSDDVYNLIVAAFEGFRSGLIYCEVEQILKEELGDQHE